MISKVQSYGRVAFANVNATTMGLTFITFLVQAHPWCSDLFWIKDKWFSESIDYFQVEQSIEGACREECLSWTFIMETLEQATIVTVVVIVAEFVAW